MLYTNADCLSNKRYDLQILLNTLTYKPRVIVVCEVNSKCNSNRMLESEFNISGYNLFAVNIGVACSRGIIVYVDCDLTASSVDISSSFSEFMFVQIKLSSDCFLTIGAIYRSPSSNAENNTALLKLINTVVKSINGKLLLLGDFNYGNINWADEVVIGASSANSPSQKFINCMHKNFLLQHVFSPTRVRGCDTPHTLDLVITNENFVDSIDYLSPLGKSDHCVLSICCKLLVSKCAKTVKYKYDKGDYNAFKHYFEENYIENDSLFANTCISEDWDIFKTVLSNGVSLCIPSSNGQSWKQKQSWRFPIKKDLKALIHRKHRLWTRFLETRNNDYLVEFKKYRNLVRKQSRIVVKNVQLNIAKSSKENPKKFWQYVNSKTSSVTNIGNIKVTEGSNTRFVTDDLEKAEVFQVISPVYIL